MLTLVRSIVSVVACRFRSRVDLELEVLALGPVRTEPYRLYAQESLVPRHSEKDILAALGECSER
jgi:hypothetical protein